MKISETLIRSLQELKREGKVYTFDELRESSDNKDKPVMIFYPNKPIIGVTEFNQNYVEHERILFSSQDGDIFTSPLDGRKYIVKINGREYKGVII